MLRYLIQQFRQLLLAAVAASLVSGACSVLLIAQINAALTADSPQRSLLAWTFAALAVGTMLSHLASSLMFERLSQKAQAELRRLISARVLAADYRRLEEIGASKIQSALSEHSTRVADFFTQLPAILMNAVIVAGCLVYMATLSWMVFIAALVVIGLGSLGYHLAHLKAIHHLHAASREQDQLFGHFRSLTDGAKELRLNWDRRRIFSDQVLGESIESVRRQRTHGMSIFLASTSWGNFLVYAFIGLVLFALVGDVPERTRVMTGFALVFLYMVTPLEALLINLPRAQLARVSATRIDEITGQMTRTPQPPQVPPAAFSGLSLRGLRHRYYHEGNDDMFSLGPVHLDFEPGQITFLVGGNGSGKTSLAKLVVGLYAPEDGEVRLNGEVVDAAGLDRYRQNFSAIFSDFHLFDRLLESPRADLDAEGNRLLTQLRLQHKVQVQGGAFTTRELSQGQRKRLALVLAYLEDRPFLMFDEWAADQDPVFKDVFYREVLPALRAQGKALLVISHDDRYFHLADRIVRMEDGQVVSIEVPKTPSDTPSEVTPGVTPDVAPEARSKAPSVAARFSDQAEAA